MAIYHLHVKIIGRASGSSAVAAAAYRSGSRLRDERIDRVQDFSAKRGVVHSEVLLPEQAPEVWRDRERLWNDVEAFEVRKDAQLAREVEFSLPRELIQAQAIELARDFVRVEFVDRGMVADLNVHWDRGNDGNPKPHAHVMLTMRSVDTEGFGPKVREWNRTELVERWRESWAELANERLAELDIDARIDHRSLEAQGIALEPQSQVGAPAKRIELPELDSQADGVDRLAATVADRAELHREIAHQNGERIIADPAVALNAITHQQSTFTRRDMARFAHRHSDGIEQFNRVMAAIGNAPDVVELGKDVRDQERFTTRQMIDTEQRLHRAAEQLAASEQHGVSGPDRQAALARSSERGLSLSKEQEAALAHVTDGRDLAVVIGYAGTGKSAMLGAAREAWDAAGYQVRGAALSGIAAENLQNGAGISSRTLASLEHSWSQERDRLSSKDILVIDEAGMVGTRQLERVLSHAAKAGAKIVLVGDPQQLQSIEAGAAFRSLHERHGGVEIGEVRRQREEWQRDATRDLANGRIGKAIKAYERNGMVHEANTRAEARDELVERWDRDRQASPDRSRIMLTHTNDEVRALNEAARDRMRTAGDLGADVQVTIQRGEHGARSQRLFASGDRIMFLQNERSLGVRNGTLGTIDAVSARSLSVRTDDGRSVAFDLKDYDRLDHGYAATIHKAQGMTVDRTFVLATPGLDSHSSYVALSRHRDGLELHYGRDDFASRDKLINTLSRDRAKDMASDYEQHDPAKAYAERRGITVRERVVEIVRTIVPERLREAVDSLIDRVRTPGDAAPGSTVGAGPEGRRTDAEPSQPGSAPLRTTEAGLQRSAQEPGSSSSDRDEALRGERTQALIRHAKAVDRVFETPDHGGTIGADLRKELNSARDAFEKVRPYGWRDAEAAYLKDPDLAFEAGTGRVRRAVLALQLETELRINPERRADQFVARWQKLKQESERQYRDGDYAGRSQTRKAMGDMAKSLERDPQLESILASRKQQLGITASTGRRLGVELAFTHGIDLGRGRSIGI